MTNMQAPAVQHFGACLGTDTAIKAAQQDVDTGAVKHHQATWADEIAAYDAQKRPKYGHPGLYAGPQAKANMGAARARERTFDTVLQRFNNPDTEAAMVAEENRQLARQNNIARDIQMLRESPFDILSNTLRLDGHPDAGMVGRPAEPPRKRYPDSFMDYNVVSNHPLSIHHWDAPENRPQPKVRAPLEERKVPAFTQKDYDPITNMYKKNHAEKDARDKELRKNMAVAKYREKNRFDPVTQKFTDAEQEAIVWTGDQAHELEVVEKAQAQMPPSIKHRATAYYNPINHEVADDQMMRYIDSAEDERKERFKNKYIVDHNLHVADMKQEQIDETRRINKVNIARFEEQQNRGYDIITTQKLSKYKPYIEAKPTPWQKANTVGDTYLHSQPMPQAPNYISGGSSGGSSNRSGNSSPWGQRPPSRHKGDSPPMSASVAARTGSAIINSGSKSPLLGGAVASPALSGSASPYKSGAGITQINKTSSRDSRQPLSGLAGNLAYSAPKYPTGLGSGYSSRRSSRSGSSGRSQALSQRSSTKYLVSGMVPPAPHVPDRTQYSRPIGAQ